MTEPTFTKEQLGNIARGSVYQSDADKAIDLKINLAAFSLTLMAERDEARRYLAHPAVQQALKNVK